MFRFRSQSNSDSEAPDAVPGYASGVSSNQESADAGLSDSDAMSYHADGGVTNESDQEEARSHAALHEKEFLQRLQSGDSQAWEQLMDEWSPKLYNYMCYNTRTAEDAQDVLSDTLLGLVQSIKNFDGNVTLSTYIYSIAYRKVADYWRRSKQTYELPLHISTAGPNSMGIELQEALAELPEQAQQALLLRYHVGLSVAEIAEVLGRSYKATESLLSRVRRQFHHAFLGAEA
ncbi:MAG: RNA polymerase sigma factor [Caldilineaceae bacterium]|nr:RNA polymerase sigma factor [Caldilineaceae bacterium]